MLVVLFRRLLSVILLIKPDNLLIFALTSYNEFHVGHSRNPPGKLTKNVKSKVPIDILGLCVI